MLVEHVTRRQPYRTRTPTQDTFFQFAVLALIAASKDKSIAVEPNVSRLPDRRNQTAHWRDVSALVSYPLPRPNMPKVRTLQKGPFNLASEVVVADIANNSTGKPMFCIA
jgi:hypothetical protein